MTTLNPTRVVLPIEPRDQDGYHLSQDVIKVRVEGPKEVEAKIEKKSGGELVAVFTATQSGDYHVHLTHNGKHIKFSPMVVKVEAKKDSHSSPPPVNLPELDKTHVKFVVDGVDGRGNAIPTNDKIEIEVSGAEKVQAKSERVEGGKIQISFDTFVRRGSFSVGVLYHGSHIHRSPFEIEVAPKDDEKSYEYDDVPVASLPSASRTIEFSVKAKTKDLQKVDARDLVGEIILGEDHKSAVSLKNLGSDDLLVSFQAFKAGKHKIKVRLAKEGGAEIVGSPFKIEVPKEAIYGN